MTDEYRLSFLDDLDKADVEITEWEANFLDDIFSRGTTIFTDGQRRKIDDMIDKYESGM